MMKTKEQILTKIKELSSMIDTLEKRQEIGQTSYITIKSGIEALKWSLQDEN